MASQIAVTRRSSNRPASHRARVSGSRSTSSRDCAIRPVADQRDSRNASPTSSGAYGLAAQVRSVPARSFASGGRRRANSATIRACRACAHAACRPNPTIASINRASDSPAGSAVSTSSSSAAIPDGAVSAQVRSGSGSGQVSRSRSASSSRTGAVTVSNMCSKYQSSASDQRNDQQSEKAIT